ncbi:hypothetical protein [Hyperthermus butylicus]|uniref:Uncharacterized protein n=1 Tax=Hyperthermus butylicus (strain DSM 5456 / JCM 9403 / PLM1-5) TaxID=415426 RepID=A2BKQ0_HYPBU|nr:hypothetical protein [Hyperthermus butylicus]ABM80561.1 hypothetical protein Hbut_0706 [Hyperthermus butylicus DSM 5456]
MPCDREAAIAALDAAIAAAKRTIFIQVAVSAAVIAFSLAALAWINVPFGGFFLLPLLAVAVMAALIPVMGYAQVSPWLRYLRQLRDGLEAGAIHVEDVCGQPLTPTGWGWRRRT